MTKYGKLQNGAIIYAPKNFILEDGSTILNFDINEKALLENGYKSIEDEGRPEYNPNFQTVTSTWEEKESSLVHVYEVSTDTSKLASYVSDQIALWYSSQMEVLVPVEEYFVKTSWFSTYSNAYQALKYAEDNGMEISSTTIVVLNKEGLLENISINSSAELDPYYQTVMLKYNELTLKRNGYLVKAQTLNIQELEEFLNSLAQN
jgi:hypothetical protein